MRGLIAFGAPLMGLTGNDPREARRFDRGSRDRCRRRCRHPRQVLALLSATILTAAVLSTSHPARSPRVLPWGADGAAWLVKKLVQTHLWRSFWQIMGEHA
jgi:hypothetical protein